MEMHGAAGARFLAERRSSVDGSRITLRELGKAERQDAEIELEISKPRFLNAVEGKEGEAVRLFQNFAADLPRSTCAAGAYIYEPIFQGKAKHSADPELLAELGEKLFRLGDGPNDYGGTIPAAYTYIGQFIAHDMSKFCVSKKGGGESLVTPALDLGSIFGSPDEPVAAPDLGHTAPGGRRQDLSRFDSGMPNVADERNDSNVALAQVQVMLTRVYRQFLARCREDARARQLTRNCFQYAVLHDFVPSLAGKEISGSLGDTNGILGPAVASGTFFVPLEFALAFFRFGHCMVRGAYQGWIDGKTKASPTDFIQMTFRGSRGEMKRLPDSWVMPWEAMLASSDTEPRYQSHARRLGARLATSMGNLPARLSKNPLHKVCEGGEAYVNIAIETLLRGEKCGLASAQELVGQLCGRFGDASIRIIPLDNDKALELALCGARPEVMEFLRDGRGRVFREHTPLWFYTLLESQFHSGGRQLGPLAGRIVGESIHAAIAADACGILGDSKGFHPCDAGLPMAADGRWIESLVRFAMLPIEGSRDP